MVQICLLRVWSFCGLWFEFWMLCESLLELMERDSRITLGFGVSISSRIQSGSGVLFLCGLLPILNFVGSWVLVKPDAKPSAFLGIIQTDEMKRKDFIKNWIFTSEKPIRQRIIPSALQSYFYSTTYTYYS